MWYPDNLFEDQFESALSFTPNNKNDSKKVNGVPLVKIYNAAFNVSVD